MKQQEAIQNTYRHQSVKTPSLSVRVSRSRAIKRNGAILAFALAILFLICQAPAAIASNSNSEKTAIESSSVINSDHSFSYLIKGWIQRIADKFVESTSSSSDSGSFTQIVLGIVVFVYGILGAILKWLLKIDIFSPFIWFVGLFSDKMRLRRFMSAFKGCEIKCNPYISIDRFGLADFKRIVRDEKVSPGVYFFYGQRDVGKKVVLLGESCCKDVSIVQIPEDKWLKNESHLCCEELLNALETVFPPVTIGHPRRLVLVLDSQTKDYQAFRQILDQVKNSLYMRLPAHIRERISIVVKMIGMYAARDIPDIHPVMIEPLSANECVVFSKEYLKRKSRRIGNAVMDEHVLFVNSMGHPSRLIKYLEGASDDDKIWPDVKVLTDWTESFGAKADESLRKEFYCLIYVLSIVCGPINLNRLIELVTGQTAESKAFASLKKAILLIVGSRTNHEVERFAPDVVFENLNQERLLIAWRAGHYGDDSQCHFADVLPAILARCAEILASSSITVYGEDFCRRMMAACVSDWTDVSKCVPRLIRMFERVKDVSIQHVIGMRLITAAYRFEFYPRYGIAENEDIADQIHSMLEALQEMSWPGWLEAVLTFAPLLCMVNEDIGKRYVSEKLFDDCWGRDADDNALTSEAQRQMVSSLAAINCYAYVTFSLHLGALGAVDSEEVAEYKNIRSLRKKIWQGLDSETKRFIMCLHRMLAYAHITELDTDACHGEWSDRRCKAIRDFLDAANTIQDRNLLGVVQVALQLQNYNLFIDDKNSAMIVELIDYCEQMQVEWDESKKGFLWTLKWYRACSGGTDFETPEGVLAVVDKVISELDVSGNKCISGNPLTIVDMMWFASGRINALWGLKECEEGVSKVQQRMMEVLKHWSPVFCLRARLRMLNYFSRMISKISLTEDDVSWLVAELRKLYPWANGPIPLADKDMANEKLFAIITSVLGAMQDLNAFAQGGERENELHELQSFAHAIVGAAMGDNVSPVLRNRAATILLTLGNFPLAVKCLKISGLPSHGKVGIDSLIMAVSPQNHPKIFSYTAYGIFAVIVETLRGEYERALQEESEGAAEGREMTGGGQVEQLSDLCYKIGFGLLNKIDSSLCDNLPISAKCANWVGQSFRLPENDRMSLEILIIKMLVVSRAMCGKDVNLLKRMTTDILFSLLDAGAVAEAAQLWGFISDRAQILEDNEVFEKVILQVRDFVSSEQPLSLAGQRKKYETIYEILRDPEFVKHIPLEVVSEIYGAWERMRAALKGEAIEGPVNPFLDTILMAKLVEEAIEQIMEEASAREWIGNSQDGIVSVSILDDEVTEIACRSENMRAEDYLLNVRQAFNMAVSAKHDWCATREKEVFTSDIVEKAREIRYPLPENFITPASLEL